MNSVPEFVVVSGQGAPLALERLRDPQRWPRTGRDEAIIESSPAATVRCWIRGAAETVLAPAGGIAVAIDPGQVGRDSISAREILQLWGERRVWTDANARGRFACVLWNASDGSLVAAVDPFRSIALHYFQIAGVTVVATDLRLLLLTGLIPAKICHSALYHYLNLSYVPAPFGMIADTHKIPANHCLQARAGVASVRRYRDISYTEDLLGDLDGRTAALRERIVQTVRDYRPPSAGGWGAFLSGGTDSSSITGILARESPGLKVPTFSIGFSERGYDELDYVQIATERFNLDSHRLVVDEDAAVTAVPLIAEGFDEPFGNSSAIPTMHCARLAASVGVHTLIAGDGGDEIFGGNQRYRKEMIYGIYYRSPPAFRWATRKFAAALSGVDMRLANRIKNFVYRGGLPNPDRFYTDDAFASEHFGSLLTPDFGAQVGRNDTLNVQREVFARAQAGPAPVSELNRLLYLDLNLTIADNDVVKVVKASKMAGVDVQFPYLDRALIDFTGQLPTSDKVHGLQLRYLFKRAMAGLVPDEILRKQKKGFGLPVSVWLRGKGRMHDLVNDVLLSPRAIDRGLFQVSFVRSLMDRHARGAWDHSAEIYLLLMLELWMQQHFDTHG